MPQDMIVTRLPRKHTHQWSLTLSAWVVCVLVTKYSMDVSKGERQEIQEMGPPPDEIFVVR